MSNVSLTFAFNISTFSFKMTQYRAIVTNGHFFDILLSVFCALHVSLQFISKQHVE